MKWRGEFIIENVTYKNEILPDGLDYIGRLFVGLSSDAVSSIRLTNADESFNVTKLLTRSDYVVDGNILTVTNSADFTATDLAVDVTRAYLVSQNGLLLARAAITAAAGSAIIVTRRDIFEVNVV